MQQINILSKVDLKRMVNEITDKKLRHIEKYVETLRSKLLRLEEEVKAMKGGI